MTDAEWRTWDCPQEMIEVIRDRISERRGRLLAVSLCRRFLPNLSSPFANEALHKVERYADGFASRDEMVAAADRIYEDDADHRLIEVVATGGELSLRTKFELIALQATWFASRDSEGFDYLDSCIQCTDKASLRWELLHAKPGESIPDYAVRLRWQRELIIEILGNPFRPVSFDASWLTSTVVGLARDIYEKRAFDQMAILADALQDAGCNNEDVLNHCRDPQQVHVRGCWVVDGVLGKS